MSVYLGFYLRGRFLEAAMNARNSEISSGRFDTAISTMPNGLLMVDGDNRVTVINARAAAKLRLPDDFSGSLEEALCRNLDVLSVGRTFEHLDILRESGDLATRSEIKVRTLDGRWLQCFFNASVHPAGSLQEERYRNTAVIILQDVTHRYEGEMALLKAACFDKLSGLANRQHWETMVDSSVETLPDGTLVAMCILDVDKFKLINDTLGHHVGDEVIAGVAASLRNFDDGRIIPGRMGGDEFVIFVPGLSSAEETAPLFDSIFKAISRTYPVAGHAVEVRCSGGVIVRTRGAFDRQADMSRADMALYKVKRNQNRSWMAFDEALEREYLKTSRIKHDLTGAIDDGSLQVVYQPIFDVGGRDMLAAEALCRWNHPEVGVISPPRFIAMAEEIGVIGKLTSYVLRTACRDCREWGADVPVAVNLSALDLARDDIVGMIASALEESALDPSLLCVEVTESVFVKDFAKTAATLARLREMGVKTSLDDFGTGYSSLSYLSHLPLNRVKIDRNFVTGIADDPKAQMLFRAVVGLAKELEFEIVVEGIEGPDELSFFRSVNGVDMIQGFIYSSPFTAEEMKSGFAARHLRGRTPRTHTLRLVGP